MFSFVNMFSFNKLMSNFFMRMHHCRNIISNRCFLVLVTVLVTVFVVDVLSTADMDHDVHFSIANATVARFAVSAAPNATAAEFDYDIRADLQIYNRYADIFHDVLVYNYLFNGTRFAGWAIPAFDQKSMTATVLPVNVTGSGAATKTAVSPMLIDEFERSSRTGVFDLELRLDGIYKNQRGDISLIAVRCPLSVRLASAVSAIGCKVIKCRGYEANGCRPTTTTHNLPVDQRRPQPNSVFI